MTEKSRILIVEDNEKNMKLMRDLLIYSGYKVIGAGDGETGLELARDNKPDLILLDIQLPGMSGIEVLEQLRVDEKTRAIPVIAVTASVMTHDRKELIAKGFNDYQQKPIEIRDFLDRVIKYL